MKEAYLEISFKMILTGLDTNVNLTSFRENLQVTYQQK